MGDTYKLNVHMRRDNACTHVCKWKRRGQYVTVLREHCILFLCPPLFGLPSTVLALPLGHVRLPYNCSLLHWPTHCLTWNVSTNLLSLSCQGVRHLVITLACWVTPSPPLLCHSHEQYLFTGWGPSRCSHLILPDHHGPHSLALYFRLSLKHPFLL